MGRLVVLDVPPAAGRFMGMRTTVREAEAAEEHQHDLCIVPRNPVATTKAIDHLKAKAELVDIPPVPGQHRGGRGE